MTAPANPEIPISWRAPATPGCGFLAGALLTRTWLAALVGLSWALFSNTGVAGTTSEDPQQSLDRMVRAGQTLNYDGTFVYRSGTNMQSMRIIHRSGGDGERERLVALTGAAREVLRDRERVTCILPDRQSVVVAKSRPRDFPHSKLFESGTGFAGHYRLSVHGGERIAGRHTKLIAVSPRDRFRYGYRLWMDRETGLLLKSELINENDEIIEELEYTNIEMPTEIPDRLLEPEISGAGYTWYRDDESASVEVAVADAKPGWYPGWLPEGFALSGHARNPILSSSDPVEHLMFSDGLASVSIFIERLDGASKPLAGLDSMGAVNAYGSMVDEFQITVVGEVPASTVERVAASVARR